MAAVLDENTLSGNYKDQYGEGPINVYDEVIQLQKMFPFNPSAMDATGQYFVELVQVALFWVTQNYVNSGNIVL